MQEWVDPGEVEVFEEPGCFHWCFCGWVDEFKVFVLVAEVGLQPVQIVFKLVVDVYASYMYIPPSRLYGASLEVMDYTRFLCVGLGEKAVSFYVRKSKIRLICKPPVIMF